LFKASSAIEMFPIASTEPNKYNLGLSIPIFKQKENPNTWNDLVETITKLEADYSFEVFDLYNGFVVTPDNLDQVKKALIPE
jgi:fructose 1,6-bisphosphatase